MKEISGFLEKEVPKDSLDLILKINTLCYIKAKFAVVDNKCCFVEYTGRIVSVLKDKIILDCSKKYNSSFSEIATDNIIAVTILSKCKNPKKKEK